MRKKLAFIVGGAGKQDGKYRKACLFRGGGGGVKYGGKSMCTVWGMLGRCGDASLEVPGKELS